MKILVVYYSRTGTTRKVAEQLTKALGANLEEIVDQKDPEHWDICLAAATRCSRARLTSAN